MVAAAVGIMIDAWRDIYRLGKADEELSYVLLAPLMIILLVWVRKDQIRNCPLRRGWIGIAILALGWAVHAFGYVSDPVIWRTGAVITAVGAFVAAVGFDAAYRFAPALAGCVFLIPVDPYGRIRFAVPLQSAAASVTQWICDLFGMYVDRAGNLLSINGVDITVAEACNGMRMVLTLFMVCYVVAFMMPLRWYVRALVLAASPLVAILANVLRLVPTVWMFGHKSIAAAEKFHTMSGWAMTILAFLLLMLFMVLLERLTAPENTSHRIVAKKRIT